MSRKEPEKVYRCAFLIADKFESELRLSNPMVERSTLMQFTFLPLAHPFCGIEVQNLRFDAGIDVFFRSFSFLTFKP